MTVSVWSQRRRWVAHTICTVLVAGITTTAHADVVQPGDLVKFKDSFGTTGGGEFVATINGGLDEFITFCLQRTEYIDFSTSFTVGGVNTAAATDAVAHGGDPVTGLDVLSPQTAWLYTQFRANALPGYDYLGPNRAQSANALQNAFWWFENELSANPNNAFVIAANLAVANGWTGLGHVRVMNLYFPDGREAQDQLVLAPPVPEPAMLALFAVAGGVAWHRRRRQRLS